MSFSYADPTSGPSAGGIGWFNFDTFSQITPGQTIPGLTGTLNDGSTVTFDLTAVNVSGGPRPFDAVPTPTYPFAQFGTSGYTLLAGNTALYTPSSAIPGANGVILSNIVVLDNLGNPVPNYTAIVADAESTGALESWDWQTNGGPWALLTKLGTGTSPVLTGLGTTSVNLAGNNTQDAAYVLSTQNPTQLQLVTTTTALLGGREAVSIGFATTHVRLQKNVADRINAADQFQLSINGTPSGTIATSGGANGIQPQSLNIFSIPGNAYTINEAMAPGSVSALTDYYQVVSAGNSTPAGTIPPVGSLPINFTPAIGDDVTYTILNAAPQVFTKTVDKAFADVGDILTYTVQVENPNNFDLNNIVVTDPTPAGTTYIGNLTVSVPFTGTDPASGITLTTLTANNTATISWQVQVNSVPPVPNPIPNAASVTVPGGISGPTNVVTTQVNTAFVSINKMNNLAFAKPGDIITYTLALNNAGNVPANNVVLTDIIPAGTTFVPGSLTGATGTPPTLTLTSPIAAMGNTTVTFQVLVGASIPNPNPLTNSATAAFTYTVDPANPNGANGTAASNVVSTQVNAAIVATTKTANAAYAAPGDIVTYTLALNNSGNAAANNVVLTDVIPAGSTFIPGSLTGATGTPPTLTLNGPISAGGNATVTFQVQIGDTVPNPNPLLNNATAEFVYTLDPANPNGQTGTSASNTVSTQVNGAIVSTVKTVDKAYGKTGDVLTYTLVLTNSGNVPANNVTITDAIPAGTTFIAGSVTGATGTPPTLTLNNPIAPGNAATVTFQVLVGNTIPAVNPLSNTGTANYTFTTDPADPNGRTGESISNAAVTQINSAIVTADKAVDTAFSDVNGTVTYTITLNNSGNVAANNVVLTDVIPAGTTYVAGSLTGATGTPPTLTLNNPVPAGGSATVTFDVLIGNTLPKPNPLENTVAAAFNYTVDPADPNGASGTALSDTVTTQVNTAHLVVTKSTDKPLSYIGDIITYQISVKNTGNVAANNAVLTDLLPTGVSLVPGSLTVSVPYSGTLATGLQFTSSIAPNQTVTLSFQAKVDAMPNPNPILNKASVTYSYTVDPAVPDGVTATAVSPTVSTIVFRYNFSQQITDLIESVALEQASLAAIANEEGAKIQKMVTIDGVTTQELLCLNKSVSDMMDSLTMLEAILKQKLNVVNCQISGTGSCK